jgi:hypothetical protein
MRRWLIQFSIVRRQTSYLLASAAFFTSFCGISLTCAETLVLVCIPSCPCALSLVVDSPNLAPLAGDPKVVPLTELSGYLGLPVTTVKRLFTKEVLDPALVEKTRGGHWRVRVSRDDLRVCHASIAIWDVLRRKPRMARSYWVRDSARTFAIELALAEINDKRKSTTPQKPTRKLAVYKQALVVLKSRRRSQTTEARWWYERLLENPEIFAGTFILRVAIERYRANYHRPPTRRELARELSISEATLYRQPFGREPLRVAYRGRIDPDAEIKPDESQDREETYIHDSEQELSPEDRHSPARKTLPPGLHEVQRRRLGEEGGRRALRREKAHCIELTWEEDPIGRGQMLRMYPLGRIDAKRRVELIEAEVSCNDPDIRIDIRRNSRKVRRARAVEAHDATFGGWTAALYEIEADGKCRWWTNFDESGGHTNSPAQACREILSVIERHKTRFPPMVNLKKMLSESRP